MKKLLVIEVDNFIDDTRHKNIQKFIGEKFIGWYDDNINLLWKYQMQELFKQSVIIENNILCPIPETLIAIKSYKK
jgi:hypothetical protein